MGFIGKSWLILMGVMAMTAFAAGTGKVFEMPLWQPGEGGANAEKVKVGFYLPEKPDGRAVVICPGGAYGGLCSSYEGRDMAKWLNERGIAGIVLYYRVSPNRHPAPLNDARRAMQLVRANAAQYGINPNKIGIMGFSAGGHLATTMATHFTAGDPAAKDPLERVSSRPDFQIAVYPVVSMLEHTHKGSQRNLLGNEPSPELLKELSNELQVTPQTPPAFVCHSVKDSAVRVINSRMYVEALRRNGVPVTYVELPKGAHGLGCGKGEDWQAWLDACHKWLQENP